MLLYLFYFITAILFIQATLVVAFLNFNKYINEVTKEDINLFDVKGLIK